MEDSIIAIEFCRFPPSGKITSDTTRQVLKKHKEDYQEEEKKMIHEYKTG
jgi:hypothetical protein